MDVVRAFNNELSSIYEFKPPVSKAKMTQITKCAIKGIKFYKHIVQSVEKFIQKCRPEYKVPGLYVVDSIVRQSRHQFGPDKDVFAPRFTKNIANTFMNLFKCAEEDRPKIVRVLNLWQKNSVFPSDVIQPLLDMANPNVASEWGFEPQQPPAELSPVRKVAQQAPLPEVAVQNSKCKSAELSSWKGWPQSTEEPVEESQSYPEITAKNLEKFAKTNYTSSAMSEPLQVPQTKSMPHKVTDMVPEDNTVKFNKKLLDFDYGDEEDDDEVKTDDGQLPNAPNPLVLSMAQEFLSNPELLSQLQQMQQTIQKNETLKSELAMQPQLPPQKEHKQCFSPEPPDNDSMGGNSLPYAEPLQPVMPYPPYDNSNSIPYAPPQPPQMPMDIGFQHPMITHDDMLMQSSHVDEDERMIYSMPGEPPLPPQDLDERAIVMPSLDERVRKERSRSRSGSRSRRSGRHRSRSRSPRRRKSRSRSRSRSRRNRSRSRERQRKKERDLERERERRKEKGIPSVKKNHISVCSTTLWLGHVPKTLSEIDISSVFSNFGQILSIDMIPPRGCAYVVMDRRQDAHRALLKLKNLKLQGCSIKMAWAPGKGVKGKEFKDYWEVDSGVSYIPFDKVSNNLQELDLLEEGGFIDEESLPQNLKDLRKQAEKEKVCTNDKELSDNHQDVMMPQPPSGATSMMPNTSMGLPMVIPQIMQPQFGMPLPGLLPPQSMVVQMPVAVPPPSQLMMVQPPAQTLLAGAPLPVGSIPQMPHMSLPHPSLPPTSASMSNLISSLEMGKDRSAPATSSSVPAGDATPTDEDGTSVSSPGVTTVGQPLSSTSVPTASSLSIIGTQANVSQFSAAMTRHAMSRPMLPVLPPVSSAGTPIPFPPPQVGFGFPPPPLRPGVPNQNLPGVIPMPNSFPWLHKAAAPPFGNFADSEMRFPSPVNPTAVSMRPPLMNTPSIHPNVSLNNQVGSDAQRSQSSSKDAGNKMLPTASQDKNSSGDGGKQFNNRLNSSSQSHSEPYGRQGGSSPQSFDKDRDLVSSNQDDTHPSEFPRDMDMGMVPRFPGPPDFHNNRGALRGHWMPGQRFPRNLHPGAAFPPRIPRMEMDFYHHQGPPGPRMHAQGPRGQQSWGGNGFPPPRNQDRFSNRRDYYDDSHFKDEDRERRFHPREERNRRDYRDEPEKRNEDDKKFVKPVGLGTKSADLGVKIDDREKKTDTSSKSDDKGPTVKTETPVKPTRSSNADLSFDLFRLQSYSSCKNPSFASNVTKTKKPSKPHSEKTEVRKEPDKEPPKIEITENCNVAPTNPSENEKTKEKSNDSEQLADESRSRRDRADRKRSRWGRTHSQEREFQQQRINEIEMKFQTFENQHQSSESTSVNGCSSADQVSDTVMDDTVVNISTEVSDSSIKEVPVSSDIIDNCHSDQTDLHPSEDNHSTLDNSNDVTHSTSDASNPALDSLFDSTAAQVPLAS